MQPAADLEVIGKLDLTRIQINVAADLAAVLQDPVIRSMSREQVEKAAAEAKRKMQKAAAELDFSAAAKFRDEMWALEQYLKVWKD